MPFDFGNMALAAMDAQKDYAATQEKLRAKAEEESIARDKMAQDLDLANQRINLEKDRFAQEKAVYQGNEALRAQQLAEAEASARKAKTEADMTEQDRATYDVNQALNAGKFDDPKVKAYIGPDVKIGKISDSVFETSRMVEPPDGKGPAKTETGVFVVADDKKQGHFYADDELPGALRLLLPTDNADQIAEKLSAEGLPNETIGAAIEVMNAQAKKTGAPTSTATSEKANQARIAFHNSLTSSVKEHEQQIKNLRADLEKQSVTIGSGPTAIEVKSPESAQSEFLKRTEALGVLDAKDPKRGQLEADLISLKSYLENAKAAQTLIDRETAARDNTIAIRNSVGQVIAEKFGVKGPGKAGKTGGGEPPPALAPANPTPADNFKVLKDRIADPATKRALDDAATSGFPITSISVSELAKAADKGPEAVKALVGKTKAITESGDTVQQLRSIEKAESESQSQKIKSAATDIVMSVPKGVSYLWNEYEKAAPETRGILVAAGVPNPTQEDAARYHDLADKVTDRVLRAELKSALKSGSPARTRIALAELKKQFPLEMDSVEAIYSRQRPSSRDTIWKKP